MKAGRRVLRIAGGLAAIAAAAGAVWVYSLVADIRRATTAVHDPGAYERVLGEWRQAHPEAVDHFPERIPADGLNVQFYYDPGFLQSGTDLELRYRTTPEQIERLYKKFSPRAVHTSRGTTLVHWPPDRGDADSIKLGQNWEVLHFDGVGGEAPEHSLQRGVILNRRASEIICWMHW